MADRVQMRAAPKMELLQILNKILRTKNEIRDIIGENDNIARYDISIHNKLAEIYNAAWKQAFHDRYYTLAGYDRWIDGPMEIWDYNINPKYYDKYDTDELTDIMKDVLNYRLLIKDELNEYLDDTVYDDFVNYPTYLKSLLDQVDDLGAAAGTEAADEVYEATSTVENPTITYSDNVFSLSSTQESAALYFKLGEDGITTLYKGQIIISEPCTIYYWAKIGKAMSIPQTYEATISNEGINSFVFPPNIYQDGSLVYINTNTNNATIYYKIDDQPWDIYYGVLYVNNNMNKVTAMCSRDGEYSKYNVFDIEHQTDIDQYRPENVSCTFAPIEGGATITLSCSTSGARIFYAIDEADGYYREYTEPINEMNTHFVLYTYSVKDGYTSKMRLIYRYDEQYDDTLPENVQYIEQGNTITLYTTTEGAVIYYRLNSNGTYIVSNSNAVTIDLYAQTTIQAYAVKNDKSSINVTSYTYYPNGVINGGKPKNPTIIHESNSNVVTIASEFEVKWTKNGSDPQYAGASYDASKGIVLNDGDNLIIRAVAVNNNVYSNVSLLAVAYNTVGGESGSEPAEEEDESNATDTDEQFTTADWFAVTGVTSIGYSGTLKYAAAGYQNWKMSKSDTNIEGLDPNTVYYLKGNVSKISSFGGNATISGDMSSLKGERLMNANCTFENLFENNINLINATNLNFQYLENIPSNYLKETFKNCSNLVAAGFTINAETVNNYGLSSTFEGCVKLTNGPVLNGISTVMEYGMQKTFCDCSRLASAYSFDISYVGSYAFSQCFSNCTALADSCITLVADGDSAPQYAYSKMFYGCTQLQNVTNKIRLLYSTIGDWACEGMFQGCTHLTDAPLLNATTIGIGSYANMFRNCSALIDAPSIYATALKTNCFSHMFQGCVSLQNAPELNYTALNYGRGAFDYMFYGCSSLNKIKAMFTTKPNKNYTDSWVYGVASSGTFIANYEATWIDSYAYGIDAIPEGWDVITTKPVGNIDNMYIQDGMVYITTKSNDTIKYKYSANAPITDVSQFSDAVEYTGPFEIPNWTGYISAVCWREEGGYGTPTFINIADNMNWPAIVITHRSGMITLKTEGNVEIYDYIQYSINTGDMIRYNGPFSINTDCTIYAEAYYNGVKVIETNALIYYGVTSPIIKIVRRDILTTVYVNISYPNPDVCDSLYYKVDDDNDDNPDTAPTVWKQTYDYMNTAISLNGKAYVNVTAIAKVNHNGNLVWSPKNTVTTTDDSSEGLSIPIFKQIAESNNVILEYDGCEYDTWTDTDVIVQYKYEQGGLPHNYQHTIDLEEEGGQGTHIIHLYGRTVSGNVTTDWYEYDVEYNIAYSNLPLNQPTVGAELDENTGKIKATISNDTYNENYQVINYIKIQVTGTDYSNAGIYNIPPYTDFIICNGGYYYIDEHITKFIVYGKSQIPANNQWTDVASTKEFDIKNDFGIQWDNRPLPVASVDNNTHIITITLPWNVWPSIKVENPNFGPGQVKKNVYENFTPINQIYSPDITIVSDDGSTKKIKLSPYLASGKLYVMYTYEGISSSNTYYEDYTNSDVQPLVGPDIVTAEWKTTGHYYNLLVKNTVNDGVTLFFRMENCVWAPSAEDTTKYLYPISCNTSGNGDQLDDKLYEAYIIGISDYEGERVESEPYHFVNEHIPTVKGPFIIFDKHMSLGYVMILDRNLANADHGDWQQSQQAAYWKIKEGTAEWADGTSEYDKYGEDWTVSFNITGGQTTIQLGDKLLKATFQVFTTYEDQESPIVEADYEQAVADINNIAPTITKSNKYTPTGEPSYYLVTFNNNADTELYPNYKWKFTDITVNTNGTTQYDSSKYCKDEGDGFNINAEGGNAIILQDGKLQVRVDDDITSAVIWCYCTDEDDNSEKNLHRTFLTRRYEIF